MKLCPNCSAEIIGQWSCVKCNWQPLIDKGFPVLAPELLEEAKYFFDSAGYSNLYKAESQNFWFTERAKLVNYLIGKYFKNAESFLELGCGTGYVLSNVKKTYPNLRVTGADIFIEALYYSEKRLNNGAEEFLQLDAHKLPYKNEFDIIGAFDVLEHIDNDKLIIANLYDALKPGGLCIVSVPQHPRLWSHMDDLACHKRRYKRKELEAKFEENNFQVVYSTSFMFCLLPLIFIRRYFPNNPNKELFINKNLNKVLSLLLSVERAFIKCGVSFPIGGSRFIVAKKLTS